MMTRIKVFRDPVHVNIELDSKSEAGGLALKLIDTREVQRLRHVRQLALANVVYHGTEHSRFSHTLGVMHVAQRLYFAACANSEIERDDRTHAMIVAAALLHDTGHPPFSHAVEKSLGVNHETITSDLIHGQTEIHQLLTDFDGESFVNDVANHITGKTDAPTAGIIKSQLDADRMDYILRDGYHAGVPNARYDLERIVQMIYLDESGHLFDERAQIAIEGYLIARYHLYLQLYYHRTNRASEVVLRSALRRAKDLAADGDSLCGVDATLMALFGADPPTASTQLNDHDLWTAFRLWSQHDDPILADLASRVLARNPFKAIELTVAEAVTYGDKRRVIDEIAQNANFPPEYYVISDKAVDTPYKLVDVTAGDDPQTSIRLRSAQGKPYSLETRSGLIAQLRDEAYQKVRLCVPEPIRDDVQRTLQEK